MGADSARWPGESPGPHCRRQYPGPYFPLRGHLGHGHFAIVHAHCRLHGANEKSLRRAAIPFQAIHLHPALTRAITPAPNPSR